MGVTGGYYIKKLGQSQKDKDHIFSHSHLWVLDFIKIGKITYVVHTHKHGMKTEVQLC